MSVNWIVIDSYNGLSSPVWHQAIIWTNVDLLPIWQMQPWMECLSNKEKSIKMHMTISANVHTRICKNKKVRVLLVVWFIFSIYLNRLHINLWMQTYITANPFNLFCVHIVLNGLHSSILWNTNPTRVKSKWNVYKYKAIWETKNMNIENEEETQLYVLNKNHHLSAMNIHSR